MTRAKSHRSAARAIIGLLALFGLPAAVSAQNVPGFDPFLRDVEKTHRDFLSSSVGQSPGALSGGLFAPEVTVDPFSGAMRISQVDAVLPGRGGLDLKIVRTYTSHSGETWYPGDPSPTGFAGYMTGGFGNQWSLHFGMLRNRAGSGSGTGPCSQDYPIFEAADGSTQIFYNTATNVFVSRDRWILKFDCAEAGGMDNACVWSPEGVRYDFFGSDVFAPDMIEGFQPYYRAPGQVPVGRITDRFGNKIVIKYQTYPPYPSYNAIVLSVVDSYQRSISFDYDGDDFLTAIHMNGNTISYRYGVHPSVNRYDLVRTLTKVILANGSTYGYEYTPWAPPWSFDTNPGAMSRMTYPSSGSEAFTYKAVNFYAGGGMTRGVSMLATRAQLDRDGTKLAEWSYNYDAPVNGMNVTTVLRPDGFKDQYRMFGFGAAGSGNIWKVGLTESVAVGYSNSPSDALHTETRTYLPSTPLAQVAYSAPTYGSCQANTPYDTTVVEPLLMSRVVTREGINYETRFEQYDAYGQAKVVTESGQQHRTTNWEYKYVPTDVSGTVNLVRGFPQKQTVCVDSDCYENSWTYNGPHWANDKITRAGQSISYVYNSDGTVKSTENGAGEKLTYGTYVYGVPSSIDFNTLYIVTLDASWEGWITRRTDGRGNATSYGRDASGRLVSITPPLGVAPTTYRYSVFGDAVNTQTTSSSGKSYAGYTVFDALGRPMRTLDSAGVYTTTAYDAMGRVSFNSYPQVEPPPRYPRYPVGNRFEYDALGRLKTLSKGWSWNLGFCDEPGLCETRYRYVADRCLERTVENSFNVTTSSCYSSFGDPDQARIVSTKTGTNQLWSYTYNAYGNLRTVTAPLPAGNRELKYDPTYQFLTSSSDGPTGTTTIPTHDAVGRPTLRSSPRGDIGYRYDLLGRPWQITYPGESAQDVTIQYDKSGNVSLESSADGGTLSTIYDVLNRPTTQTWNLGGASYVTSSSFDELGCPETTTYPTGSTVVRTCDSANRVTGITYNGVIVAQNIQYHPSGQVKSLEYGNGLVTTIYYDSRGRPAYITAAGVMSQQYHYDNADNVTSIIDYVRPETDRRMTYDPDDRLDTVTAPNLWGVAAYDYDALGNRILDSLGSYTTSFLYDTQRTGRLVSATGPTFVSSGLLLSWTRSGRLATSSEGAGTTYHYDPRGRRVSRVSGGATVLYLYDSAGALLSEARVDGTKLRDYVYLDGKLLMVDGCIGSDAPPCTKREWFHVDVVGSPVARTNSDQAVVARLDMAPWGEEWSFAGEAGQRRFNGRLYDSGTGLLDYGARLYLPRLGRFISPDPVAPNLNNAGSFNRYSYVYNNPYKYTDPEGQVPFLVVTAGIGALAGGAWGMYTSIRDEGHVDWTAVGKGALVGGGIGLGLGAGAAVAFAGSATASVGAVVGTASASAMGAGGAAAYRISQNLEIPTSITNAGQTVRILPSAVKHLEEFAGRGQDFATSLNVRLLGETFMSAVNQAIQNGIQYGTKVNVGGWELIFQEARDGGSPVLIHALQITTEGRW